MHHRKRIARAVVEAKKFIDPRILFMNAAAARPQVDLSKPRSQRPMLGLDIEEWRGELGLSKYDAQYALGFRNSNHYNKMCQEPLLPVSLELLIRLYEVSPIARSWDKYTMRELFQLMYGPELETFKGTRYETYARVDMGTRFAKFFDRSSARQYQWLGDDPKRNESELNAYSVMECILGKLKHVEDPKATLEKAAKKVWALRGVDLDTEFRVPTMDNPPVREKTGRKRSEKPAVARGKSARVVKTSTGKTRAPAKKAAPAKPVAVKKKTAVQAKKPAKKSVKPK